ncbi:hypothetical protein [Hymenobacter defluvii]|uniref:Uncharacterized protein n=1 Tax=Hymenobacter defluvii TaxID=2054411 RepID=A0ABS3THE0_9BACT|nr:hypothetical protein [Hymenobacter defluvii]MBO3273087.1 hypothetical protein [Hymenobacter defluvii]
MSQHIFQATSGSQAVRVQAGWDRPLQHYYLLVETVCEKEEDETYLFVSDLGDGLPVEAIQPALKELKITPPKGFLKEVCFDGEVNMGNKCKNWDRRTSARHRRRPLNLLNRPRVTLLLRKSGYAERFFARFTRDNRPDLLIFLWQLAEQYPKLVVAR